MQVVYERCCGLDVHKTKVVACLITSGKGGKPHKEIRTFGTTTGELNLLSDWLSAAGCTHVAMESTGVYWKPVYYVLEGNFELLVVNARDIKQVPGRKTDVSDAEWIAELLRHGLLRGSFVPPKPIRELRALTRHRKTLVREKARVINRIQKVLEDANIKLASVASNILGASGRAILQALAQGANDPYVLAELAKGSLRSKLAELEKALSGVVEPHHRFLLQQHLAHIDFLEQAIALVEAEIEERMLPFAKEVEQLMTIPGIKKQAAWTIIAEIGIDMGVFPSHKHLASWAGLCPGNNESAGKRKTGRTRKGNPWLREVLVEAAWAASRTRKTYLAAQYHRLAARRGKKRALVAVAHSILVIAYHLLAKGTTYRELGPNFFDQLNHQQLLKHHVRRLAELGYRVTLEPEAVA
ncbi:MAG: IS110 family transposase [Syntrophothermus sp.]|uniref:IS110 family transposase n=1 Tax=Syntrophothermus sp. TaxID=2736299 RepID=UPI00257A83D2|nr:IS110 family transposase [Syntrophothermus sp.]NSW84453.1 IS110 family transposase [Syntrophothermus sp.]